jgi:TonB family protein
MKNFSGFAIIVATIFSTIIHFFVLALFDTIPLLPKEIPLRSDIFMVDLVTIETASAVPFEEEKTVQIQEAVEATKPEEKKEVKKEEVRKEVVKREEVKDKKEVVEEVKEVKKKEEIKKEDKTVVADTSTKQEKKEKAEEQPLDLEGQRLAAIEKIRQGVSDREPDGPSAKVTDAEIKEYESKVIEEVKRSWAILNIWSEKELEAFIVIEVDEKGQVITRIEESSGNLAFDQAALRAIRKASPFGPPPNTKALTFLPLRFSSR